MKIKKSTKIIIFFAILIIIAIPCLAASGNFNTKAFESGKAGTKVVNLTRKYAGSIVKAIRTVGSAAAAGVLMVISAKYMLSSAGERAEFKKQAIPYTIGAIILFGASNIIGILGNLATQAFK